MKITDLVGLALSRLGTGKLRTALTMLGIIIGVASVVALVSVAEGATKGISDQLQSLGTNLITVSPGFTRTGATRGAIGSATTLTLDDANALASLDGVGAIAPEITTNKLISPEPRTRRPRSSALRRAIWMSSPTMSGSARSSTGPRSTTTCAWP